LEWQAAGVFEQLWRASLLEYDELEGMLGNGKALTGAIGPRRRWHWNRWAETLPTRGKNGSKRSLFDR